jgi:hypothetical protein
MQLEPPEDEEDEEDELDTLFEVTHPKEVA